MTLPTELYHYTENPIEKLIPDFHPMIQEYMSPKAKPYAFWFSVEDYEGDENWKTWCQGEEFRLEGLAHRYKVILKSDAKILLLNNAQQVIDFGMKYQGNDQTDFNKWCCKYGHSGYPYVYMIKWNEVCNEYDGIIIAPYQWSCRMEFFTSWYYGWDCSSGCIWNYDAIDRIEYDIQLLDEKHEKSKGMKQCQENATPKK